MRPDVKCVTAGKKTQLTNVSCHGPRLHNKNDCFTTVTEQDPDIVRSVNGKLTFTENQTNKSRTSHFGSSLAQVSVVHTQRQVVLFFSWRVQQCAMVRRGWSVMEVPDGWLQVLRRPRPPAVRWPKWRRRCRRNPVQFSSESVSLGQSGEVDQCPYSSRVEVAVAVGVRVPSSSE